MGTQQSIQEKEFQDLDYCQKFGEEKGTAVYRNPYTMKEGKLIGREDESINSLYQNFKKNWKAYKNENCLGTKTKDGENFVYKWKSYDQVYNEVQVMATALKEENLAFKVYDGDFAMSIEVIGICSVNREEWLVTDLACNLLNITSVPLYETLGEEMLQVILKQTEMTTLFGSDVCVSNVLKTMKGLECGLKTVVIFDKEVSDGLKALAQEHNINILMYWDLMDKFKNSNRLHDESHNKLDTIFTISYTSGTSGNSKGVLLSNRNFLSAITNILQMASIFKFSNEDVYISYLPLAHVFDRLGCHTILGQGGSIGFFGGKILEITSDLQILKPTIFPSVPRLLNKVYDRVVAGVQLLPLYRRYMFYQGIVSKSHYNGEYGWVENQIFDKLIFSKAKERLGGRVRIMITGSAPIAPNILSFLRCVFCCPIVEAYGQTESCGASFGTKVFDNTAGHVGAPGVGVEFKLEDLPEMKYTRDSKPYPAGEICIRGPAVFKGYFKNLLLTAETIDADGWLKTGDVGCITEQNKLKIIDRVKNIFKLSQGEYIVPEKLERSFEQSPLIQQIFIHGDSLQSHIVAIIYPEPNEVKRFCEQLDLTCEDSHAARIKLPQVRKQIESDMARIATEQNYNGLEKVRHNFALIDQEFPPGQVLTPTLKLIRKNAREVYKKEIAEIYERSAQTTKKL